MGLFSSGRSKYPEVRDPEPDLQRRHTKSGHSHGSRSSRTRLDDDMSDSEFIQVFIKQDERRRAYSGHANGVDALIKIILNLEAKLEETSQASTEDDFHPEQPSRSDEPNGTETGGQKPLQLPPRSSHRQSGQGPYPPRPRVKEEGQAQRQPLQRQPPPDAPPRDIVWGLKRDLSSLQQKYDGLKKENAALDSSIRRELADQKDRHQEKMRQIREDHSVEFQTRQDEFDRGLQLRQAEFDRDCQHKDRQIWDLSGRINGLLRDKKAFEDRDQQRRAAAHKELEQLHLKHQKEKLEQGDVYQKQLNGVRVAESERSKELKADKEELREQVRVLQARISRSDDEINVAREKVREEFEADMAKLKANAEEEVSTAKAKAREEVDSTKRKAEHEVETARRRALTDVAEVERASQAQMEGQRRAFEADARTLNIQHAAALAEKERDSRDELDRLVQGHRQDVEQLTDNFNRAVSDRREWEGYANMIQQQGKDEAIRTQESHHQAVEMLKGQFNDQMREVTQGYEVQIADLEKRLEAEEGRVTAHYSSILGAAEQKHKDAEFDWQQTMMETKEEGERQAQALNERIAALEGQLRDESARYGATVDKLQGQHRAKALEQKTWWSEHLAKVKRQHESGAAALEARLKAQHEGSIRSLRDQNNRIKADLLSGQRLQLQAWTDETLKIKFEDFKQLVGDLVSPHQLDKRLLYHEAERIDPRFSEGQVQNSHYLIKSQVWQILYQAFFSLPFGFGALREKTPEVMAVYKCWRKLRYGPRSSEIREETALEESFRQDVAANIFRSAVFQTLVITTDPDEAVQGGDADASGTSTDSKNHAYGSTAYVQEVHQRCKRETQRQLMGLLGRLGATGHTERLVAGIADAGLELALQFGVHPAELALLWPKGGDILELGAEFNSCLGEGMRRGDKESVDFVVAPGICRTGDGKKDTAVRVPIVPCDIFPASHWTANVAGNAGN